ncbi:MAG: hypothetical protein NZ805_01970 [Armatimonadetes bacterium]|nr:hypothetical protein [Armatimonadota bacterium]MDW8026862.1 hypothetical protein [Armatimonadota bacterium]
MDEAKEAQCRCGNKVYTVPSISVRCPQCGRRLFWKCQCGALLERMTSKCPYCGFKRERRYESSRPPLRLRTVIGSGLIGAILFTALGYWLLKLLPHTPLAETGSSLSSLPQRGGNIIAQTFKGLVLLVRDFSSSIWRIVSEHPVLLIFAIIGFSIAATLAARKQNFSWHRLKRHLRRKWEDFTSRWL